MSHSADVDAVVLVGGQGTRLRPLTLSAAKPMLPRPACRSSPTCCPGSRGAGLTHVVLGTSYRAETFSDHFGDGAALGLEIEYVVEDHPLGTGGASATSPTGCAMTPRWSSTATSCPASTSTALLSTHRDADADVTLHLVRVSDPRAFGCVPTDATGRVLEFLEKTENPPTDQINAGCYVFRRSVLESIPAGRPVSVERETFPGLLASGAWVQGYVDSSYWLDLGTPAAFVRGSSDLVQGRAPSGALPGPAGVALVLDGAVVAQSAVVEGGSVIGSGARVADRARVETSVVFDGAVIGAGAEVVRSVVGAGARIGDGAIVVDAVIGDRAIIGARCELLAGVRVWPDVELPAHGVRFSADV